MTIPARLALRTRGGVVLASVAAVALTMAACSRKRDAAREVEPPAPAASTPEVAPSVEVAKRADAPVEGAAVTEGPAEPAGAAGGVTLLQAGSPPLRLLRTRVAPGTRQSLEVASRITPMKNGPEGQVRQAAPILKVALAVVVDGAAMPDDVRYRWTLERVDVGGTEGMPPPAVEAMRRGLDRLPGSSGTGSLDSRGLGAPSEFMPAEGAGAGSGSAAQRFSTVLDQLLVPLPAEAVGVGARWQVRKRVEEDGFQVDVITTYDLQRMSGDELAVHSATERGAPRQVVKEPGGLPNSEAELLQLQSKGEANYALDLTLPWPVRATSFLVSTQAFRLTLRGEPSHVMQATEVTVELVSR